MSTRYKIISIFTLVTSLLCSAQLNAAGALTDNDVVNSSDGHIIRSILSGECVRTKWPHGSDECASPAKMVEKQEPRRQFVTTLEEQERSVYFEFNKSTLTPEAMNSLDGLSKKLLNAKDISSTEILGFADRIGSVEDNQKLSMRRAQSVKNYLASRGYLKSRVAQVSGLGESQSTTSCAKSMSRKKAIICLSPDRRVEINVHYTETTPATKF
ncbi:OmpA family protein [Rickettsiales bacterium]|nr:OmpA family protein [Rickettsiales bacterium]